MHSNPLTPPSDYSAEAIENDTDNGTTSVVPGPSDYATEQFATPMSTTSTGLEAADGCDRTEDGSDTHDMSDEDQDMSDGGAALTMTLSHAEELNAELDLLDAEVMGHDNLVGLLLENHYPAENPFQYSDSLPGPHHYSDESPGQPEGAVDVYMQGTSDSTSLPTSLSAVSVQLQHIQDGQEHAESVETADELHGAFINNSTSSLLFPFFSSPATSHVSHGDAPQVGFVSLGEVTSGNVLPAPAGPPNPPQFWSTEGWTPSSTLDVVVPPQALQSAASHSLFQDFDFSNLPWENGSDTDQYQVDDQSNLSLGDFLYSWGMSSSLAEESKKRPRGPILPAFYKQRSEKLPPVHRNELQGDRCDIQRINWAELGVLRSEATQMRRSTYKNYTNLRFAPQWHPRLNGARLSDDQNFLRFRRMDFDEEVHLSHFQLRNLLACASRDHIFYAGKSKILQWSPETGMGSKIAMDLTDPVVQPFHSFSRGIQISTLTVAHDILVAGGFCGEYGLVNLKAQKDTKHTEGLITDDLNSITNHVQVHESRGSSLPLASFASNDKGMRILDISTNKFIAEHKYDHAINCSAVSPDQRLRVLVGDTRSVMICNSETGEILQNLEGHRDFGFACDWADDGWTMATGNQDMQVKIWDARKWTTSNGRACPVATVAAEMAGVRKLKFSPLGSGKRVLLAAEPADVISVIDAENFISKQTLSFFGEIGGLDFTNDGQDLYVAVCDNMRGGIMEFERCDWAGNSLYNLEEYEEKKHRRRQRRHEGYDWIPTDDDIVKHPKSRGTREHRRRKAAALGITMGHF